MDRALACSERFQCRTISAPTFGRMSAGRAPLIVNQASVNAGFPFRR
jgi:hypothetical protein